MNIKEHIEAGHYGGTPVVEVPTRSGEVARIYSTRHPSAWCIVGVVGDGNGASMWTQNGRIADTDRVDEPFDLMPPRPRKMRLHGFAVVRRCDDKWVATIRGDAAERSYWPEDAYHLVPLIGEYDRPRS